ncbi:peptide-N-glycosidase F-related protein [Epilithonimonas mollis]|uniref:Por secretion system C-terminal sorting domain-containing protein n=1 Tax=Epilithonimonas mollis TaxID=216903 RepID=A0A1M6T6Z0_9FLAO|nr:peptide-N-glycosidase F-related protein [Epilithonimonas mollis]SHK52705.1 Por secretion system C-terminal sorting domain-containing protein [Epilithonimonas mollis]
MKKKLLFAIASLALAPIFKSQNISVFNDVPFYSMYHYLGDGETLPVEAYEQIPAGAIRLHAYEQDIISRKLTSSEIASIGSSVKMNILLTAACDNYDRIAGVNLVLVPKGSTAYTYNQADIKRIEMGRFITPFMNKNVTPTQVPYSYQIDNISDILHDSSLSSVYDFWIEFRADGYSAAAQTQVSGCANRTDVFRGNLELVSSGSYVPADNFFLPLSYRQNLNNYNATDVPGQTTRLVNFTLDQPIQNVTLYLITSNHGSNTGGEEYVRREHFVYLDNQVVHQYKPGGKSCEDYRQYNTQGNGIYGTVAKPPRNWMNWNNWCPGDAVPNREINLGNLSAGSHTIKINVPDAVFKDGQGYFPISMYIQNQKSGQIICAAPTELKIASQIGQAINISWKENGNANQWETIWSRKNVYTTDYEDIHQIENTPADSKSNLTLNWLYEMYVKSKCTNENISSLWTGPIYSTVVKLGTNETEVKKSSVYPNPVKDIINISSNSKVSKVGIYNIDGKMVSEANSDKIDLSKFSSGIYLMKIDFADGSSETQKVIKR